MDGIQSCCAKKRSLFNANVLAEPLASQRKARGAFGAEASIFRRFAVVFSPPCVLGAPRFLRRGGGRGAPAPPGLVLTSPPPLPFLPLPSSPPAGAGTQAVTISVPRL